MKSKAIKCESPEAIPSPISNHETILNVERERKVKQVDTAVVDISAGQHSPDDEDLGQEKRKGLSILPDLLSRISNKRTMASRSAASSNEQYIISGIPVFFPFKAYPCQISMMGKVF